MRGYLGIIVGFFTWILVLLGHQKPEWVEQLYSRGLYQGFRAGIDPVLGLLPFPAVYLLMAWLLFAIGSACWKWCQNSRWNWKNQLRLTGNAIGWLIAAFFWLWGFNYLRVPVEQVLQLNAAPLPLPKLKAALYDESRQLQNLRAQLDTSDRALDEGYLPTNLENSLRNTLELVLTEVGYPVAGRVRGRLLYPRGTLLHFSTAGIYLPFTAEGHIDAGLHPVQLPYTMAHELAHGYGFGDEGVCNFWAYLTCMRSQYTFIRYSGSIGYWRYLAAAYRRADPQGFLSWRKTWPKEVEMDLEAIQQAMNHYPDWIPELQYQVYDSYLKTQGVKAGMLSYSQVLRLVEAWKARPK